MDLKNVNNLESKIKLWRITDLIAWLMCVLSLLLATLSVTMHCLTLGYILSGVGLLAALVGGFSHIYVSVLDVEVSRATTCPPRKNNKKHEKKQVRGSI